MDSVRIIPGLLGDRLDAGYNSPSAVLARRSISESEMVQKPLSDLFEKLVCGPFGSTLTASEHKPEGEVLLIQPTNISAGSFSLEKSWRIGRRELNEKGLKLYPAGTFLFARAGVYPHVGVIPASVVPATISSSMIAGVGKNAVDAHYLEAFFKSKIGLPLLYAAQKQTAQPTIGTYELERTVVLCPTEQTQKHIGAKVRQAERFREFVQQDSLIVNELLDSVFHGEFPKSFHEVPRRVESKYVSPTSLSGEHARALLGHSLLENSSPLRDFVSECKCGDPIRKDARVKGDYPYYGASGPIDQHNDFNFDGKYLIVAQDGTIGRASIARGRFWANNHVWVVSVKDQYDADAIAAYLDRAYPFWKGMTTGSVIPKVTSENLLSVVVPKAVACAHESLGDPLRRMAKHKRLSDQLIQSAKLLVEALIERRVTEAELAEAQTQLESGDPSADRAILGRLHEGGIDATDTPLLFPDLDAYYETLQMAEQVLAQGGDE